MSSPQTASSVLFGKTRQAILSLLFTRPDESFYLREIVRRTGGSPGAVQRELALLAGCGILSKDKNKFFRANHQSPVHEPLKQLVVRTIGVADVLRNALAPVAGQIAIAFLFGSFARGEQGSGSDVDLMVISQDKVLSVQQVTALLADAQAMLGREINPFVLPAKEFRAKWLARNHFVHRVLEGKKVFLIGADNELKRLAEKRLVKTAINKSRRKRSRIF